MLELSSWAPILHIDRHEGYGMVTTIEFSEFLAHDQHAFLPNFVWEFQVYTVWDTQLTCVF